LSFLPQFIDNQSAYAQQQMLLLGAIFVVMGFFVMSIYAVVAEKLRFWISKNKRIQAYLNWITGAIFIGFGLRVAFSERR
jgi:threonine/homoserine/homoserine lactone efflux protein